MKSIEDRLKEREVKYWNEHKESLLLFHAIREHKAGVTGEQILPADGNTIIKQIARRAFECGFNCGTTEMFDRFQKTRGGLT